MVWTDYRSNIEWHFNPQVTTPDAREPAERDRRALSEDARRRLKMEADIRYGPAPRQMLDLFPAPGPASTIHVYFHGGYWRRGDKSASSYVAIPSVDLGVPTAVMGYGLCPAVTIEQVIAEALDGIEWVHRNGAHLGVPGGRVFLSGHSVGAHLCAIALAHDWRARGIDSNFIVGAALVSGIYDLEPVPYVSVNEQIKLTPERVRALSPMFHPPLATVPVILAVGGRESDGWIDQTLSYAAVCRTAGCPVEVIVFPDDNHYSISIKAHIDGHSPVMQAMSRVIGEQPRLKAEY